jgi:cell pole-organizing protein PopZ
MITRDNYEEFFLLYIDNELSVSDRETVERFVAHHPDLQDEWKSLLHCRLLPEEQLVFPDRETLYRTEMMEEEEDLPRFSPDLSIVFPDKASLYKEEEDKRIIWLPWLRIAVAAVTVGIVALLVLLSARHTPVPSAVQPIVKNNKNISPVTPAATPTLYSSGTRDAGGTRDVAGTKPVIRLKTDKPVVAARKEKKAALQAPQDVQEEIRAERPDNKDLAQQAEPHDLTTGTHDLTPAKTADITATKVVVATPTAHSSDAVAALQSGIPKEESSFATQALHETENHDPENNILVSAESTAPGKGKLRGLFRKVTRTFGKTADRDNDGQREVLVGAFQFALK